MPRQYRAGTRYAGHTATWYKAKRRGNYRRLPMTTRKVDRRQNTEIKKLVKHLRAVEKDTKRASKIRCNSYWVAAVVPDVVTLAYECYRFPACRPRVNAIATNLRRGSSLKVRKYSVRGTVNVRANAAILVTPPQWRGNIVMVVYQITEADTPTLLTETAAVTTAPEIFENEYIDTAGSIQPIPDAVIASGNNGIPRFRTLDPPLKYKVQHMQVWSIADLMKDTGTYLSGTFYPQVRVDFQVDIPGDKFVEMPIAEDAGVYEIQSAAVQTRFFLIGADVTVDVALADYSTLEV